MPFAALGLLATRSSIRLVVAASDDTRELLDSLSVRPPLPTSRPAPLPTVPLPVSTSEKRVVSSLCGYIVTGAL